MSDVANFRNSQTANEGEMARCRCTECEEVMDQERLDFVADPKSSNGHGWSVCPECRGADCFVWLCSHDGCLKDASCGTPSTAGYQWTCFQHRPLTQEQP